MWRGACRLVADYGPALVWLDAGRGPQACFKEPIVALAPLNIDIEVTRIYRLAGNRRSP